MNSSSSFEQSVQGRSSSTTGSLADAEALVRQYPYFSPARLLYLRKLRSEGSLLFESELSRAGLWLPAEPWLDQLVQESPESATLGAVADPMASGEATTVLPDPAAPSVLTDMEATSVLQDAEATPVLPDMEVTPVLQDTEATRDLSDTDTSLSPGSSEPVGDDLSNGEHIQSTDITNFPDTVTEPAESGPLPETDTETTWNETDEPTPELNSLAHQPDPITLLIGGEENLAVKITEAQTESTTALPLFNGSLADQHPSDGERTTVPDTPEEPDTETDREEMLPPLPAFRIEPIDPATAELSFEPFHTVDYFASQGIVAREDDPQPDRFSKQLRSFTDWLKTMKRIGPPEAAETPMVTDERRIERMAEHSVETREVVTEAMAAVWEKQGNKAKAREIYRKLSLLDPDKSAYFATKIDHLK